MSLNELRTQMVTPATFFWYEGLAKWKPGRDLPELSSLFNGMSPDPLTASPVASASKPAYESFPACDRTAYGSAAYANPTLKPTPPAYQWYLEVWEKYAHFTGRARRSEYWYFTLFHLIIIVGLIMVMGAGNMGALLGLSGFLPYMLAAGLPSLAVRVRRMHDVGKSGWNILIPFRGFILACTEGDIGPNQYGEDPKHDF